MGPAIGGVLETALWVYDLARSVRFYQDLFGFEIMSTSDRACALIVPGPGPQLLLLCKTGASTKPTVTAGGTIPPCDGAGPTHLAFSTSKADIERWEQWFAQHGVAVESRVTWERGGTSLYLRDPDGHLLELATPGTWPVY